jgi:F-type H+-transporting ATPase subunit epsilon
VNAFPLKIVTPDGVAYEGHAQVLTVRTSSGDMGIMAGHINCVAPLGMGRATIVIDDKPRYAACIGGMLSVLNGAVTLVPTTFEWAENIDPDRAERSRNRAQAILDNKNATKTEIALAEARLKRALVRKGVCSMK